MTLIWSTNASLPKISYIKSIDVYLVFCFFMTFLSVIEFGIVSFMHRFNEKIKLKNQKTKELLLRLHSQSSPAVNDSTIQVVEVNSNKQHIIKANSVDKWSRVFFPLVFFIFHIAYWTFYLTITIEHKKK